MEEYLSSKRGQKVRIRVPKKGSKEKMVELAERNAQIVLDQDRERIKREEGRTVGAVKEIARWLNLRRSTASRRTISPISAVSSRSAR